MAYITKIITLANDCVNLVLVIWFIDFTISLFLNATLEIYFSLIQIIVGLIAKALNITKNSINC